jgi:hypothetical protein
LNSFDFTHHHRLSGHRSVYCGLSCGPYSGQRYWVWRARQTS